MESSPLPRKLPFRRIPLTALDVDICLLCANRVELLDTKFPLLGSSKTTDARLTPLEASLEAEAVSDMDPPSRSTELTERLDSVLCMLLF